MAQTLGNQALGEWYDIISFAAFSGVFFYWAFAAQNLSTHQREKLPGFLTSKPICIALGALMAVVAFGKILL